MRRQTLAPRAEAADPVHGEAHGLAEAAGVVAEGVDKLVLSALVAG